MDYSRVTLVEISKAAVPSDAAMKRKGYRPSHLRGINPLSDTFVREGTGLKRLGGPIAGTLAGSAVAVGANIATKGKLSGYPAQMISAVGGSLGTSRNIRSGDTVSYRSGGRYKGLKAKSKWVIPGATPINIYSGKAKKRIRDESE